MKLIKADHDRRLQIAGVPGLVRRPVDIDQSQSGLANLRSLRIYRFDTESVINGHAEEDEVLVTVMTGVVELTMSENNSEDSSRPYRLSAASNSQSDPCAAYLPPHAAYQLIPRGDADVAYARATTAAGRPPTVFTPEYRVDAAGVTVLLDEANYPRRLQLRLVQIDAREHEIAIMPNDGEALVHLRTMPAEGVATITKENAEPTRLSSWDTISVMAGDNPTLRLAMGSRAVVLIVLAT